MRLPLERRLYRIDLDRKTCPFNPVMFNVLYFANTVQKLGEDAVDWLYVCAIISVRLQPIKGCAQQS